MNECWYCVRGLFHWRFKESGETALFEERAILVKATSFDDALNKAEEESMQYCKVDIKANYVIESLNNFTAHEIIENHLSHGVELFSKRIELQMSPTDYLSRFHNVTII